MNYELFYVLSSNFECSCWLFMHIFTPNLQPCLLSPEIEGYTDQNTVCFVHLRLQWTLIVIFIACVGNSLVFLPDGLYLQVLVLDIAMYDLFFLNYTYIMIYNVREQMKQTKEPINIKGKSIVFHEQWFFF